MSPVFDNACLREERKVDQFLTARPVPLDSWSLSSAITSAQLVSDLQICGRIERNAPERRHRYATLFRNCSATILSIRIRLLYISAKQKRFLGFISLGCLDKAAGQKRAEILLGFTYSMRHLLRKDSIVSRRPIMQSAKGSGWEIALFRSTIQ